MPWMMILNFFRKTWKLWAALGVAGVIFFAGAFWADKRHAEQELDFERKTALAIAAREQDLRAEHEAQLEADAEIRIGLASDLDDLRAAERELTAEVGRLELVNGEFLCEIGGENDGSVDISNPFSIDFSRLWNTASGSE